MGQGGKRSLEGVKERILGQVGGALVSSSDSAVTELRSLGNLLVFFLLSIKQCHSTLNSIITSTPPWNGQADVRFGLVHLMIIGHSSLKHNTWWKCTHFHIHTNSNSFKIFLSKNYTSILKSQVILESFVEKPTVPSLYFPCPKGNHFQLR